MTANLRAIGGERNQGRSSSDELHLLVIDPRSLTRDCLVAALENAHGVASVTAAGSIEEGATILAGLGGHTAALLEAWRGNGEGDSLPEGAFMYVGTLEDAKAKAAKMAAS